MPEDIVQIILLLIVIQIALSGYYYLLYQEKEKLRKEDALLLKLEEKFSDTNMCSILPKKNLPTVCNGFHDNFFKDNNKFLGWRYFYIRNQNNNQIEDDKNFEGTNVRNFLNNLENVNNEVTPKQNQIR
jgi:hypothetical protein